mmetsp:Transcript_51985/g.111139  ORF Transcript_51985/g.111139 Transcript_51985/m.111139 type:complete len:110 (-) Transcript_51985:50-379(-)|eukprot:CAMPEP_0183357916 /NCGR_PEP_ID=MMETSP0164_2-20130417/47713_1 /TAXON_ID=221442 /ORGANISM="Coccolithus pelagicus ssp braarudi, Strain PLY182g" /LENGTH=109 /DNA_ID=CAMNT_0025531671 /DNA_START=53 /DNA_END=382 /DNA_ORIENTATION=+
MKAEAVFKELAKRINADMVKQVGVVYRFDITDGDAKKSWMVDLKNGSGKITEGEGKAQCTIIMSDSNFVKLMNGSLNPMEAFMGGKLKIRGDLMASQKLSALTASAAKL